MYTPKHFAESETDSLLQLMSAAPLGTLIVNGESGFEANHIPFIHDLGDDGACVLRAHIPRANLLSELLRSPTPCLVIFNGPDGYISPSWYATKQEHGRVVPTWNYSVAHVHGSVVVIDDPDWVLAQIHDLTERNEKSRPEPWAVSDAPDNYTRVLLASLVGLEVSVSRIEGKTKASQNQPERNKVSILGAMSEEQPDTALSGLMRRVLDDSDSAQASGEDAEES
ncbi:MAG: FMN-binding negative transcriptional regulator [Pseudomonadota bacterium]